MSGLKVSDLNKSYGNVNAVNNLNIEVEPGKIIGFLGPNGAGKSTTMRCLMGVTSADSGSMTWKNKEIDTEFQKTIGYMPQERGLYPRMKVGRQIEYFARLAGLSKTKANEKKEYWLNEFELTDRENSQIQELSGGNQQRVQLIVSIIHNPELMLLDEPFSGLDPIASQVMRDVLKSQVEKGSAILFSSHQLSLVSDICDSVVIIANGSVQATGTTQNLRNSSLIRNLKVKWEEPKIDSWLPEGKIIIDEPKTLEAEVSSKTNLDEVLTKLSSLGSISEFSYQPPSLDQIFAEAVEESEDNI